jgi:DNA polymerase-3 subunit epsilon
MTNLATLLRLTKPLAVLDCESTGLDPEKDRIIQLAITIHYEHRDPIAWASLVNPGIPIPQNVHGLTDADVKDAPTFARIAPALAPKLLNVDIAGYHVTFDIAFLRVEFRRCNVDWPWAGTIIDGLQVFRKKEPHSLVNAYKRYVDPNGFGSAHDAGADVAATADVLLAQLKAYPDLPRNVEQLSAYCFPGRLDASGKFRMVNGVAICTFGKHKDKALKDVPRDYLDWLLANDFPADVKTIAADAKLGKYPGVR